MALLAPHRALLVAGGALLLAAAVAHAAVPPLLGRVVDVAGQGSPDSRRTLLTLASGVLLALALRAVLAAAAGAALARLAEAALARLREDVVERALDLPLADLEATDPGDLLQRVGGDVEVLSQAARSALPVALVAGLDVLVTTAGLALLDPRLALAGLVPLPVWVLATRWYARRSSGLYAAERTAESARTQALLVAAGGASTARTLGLGGPLLARVQAASQHALASSTRASTAQSTFGAMLNAAELVGVLALLLTGLVLVRGDAVSVGVAAAAVLCFLRLFDPVGELLFLLDPLQSGAAALARLVGVTDLPRGSAGPAPTPVPAAAARVCVRGLRFAYDDGTEVLHGVDLDVAPGQRVAVVGPSGAGKSTLGALVAGTRRPGSGTVRVAGSALSALSDLRRHVVLVPQDVHPLAATVRGDLRLAAPDAPDVDLRRALERVGAGLDLDDPLDATTSPELLQLLALARLVLVDPPVAVLDEATAEAGSAGARRLERAVDRALEGRTAVVVAHRLGQAVAADRVVVLEQGRVVEEGTHQQLVDAGGAYARL